MEIYTSGTSGIPAERFFLRLRDLKITSIIDTRVNPSSQLAGYAKQDSLRFFSKEILDINYIYEPLLCPEAKALKAYRNEALTWSSYQNEYLQLLKDRKLQINLEISNWGERPLLLCSEQRPDKCHRSLATELLEKLLPNVTKIIHL